MKILTLTIALITAIVMMPVMASNAKAQSINYNSSKSNSGNRTYNSSHSNTSSAVTFGRDKLKGTTKTQGDFNQGSHATERAIKLNSSKSN